MARQPTSAQELEQALLPTNLPDVPGWSIASLYRPAGDNVLVGGDFYDWFARPDGSFGFLIGDVEGKGQVAATVGMAIRKGLKALLWAVPAVCDAVPLLEQALADDLCDTFASFCYLELGRGSVVRALSAGHPAPWLVRPSGAGEVALFQNTPLGMRLTDEWVAEDLEVRPGEMLLLFSDGLTEARLQDGRLFGEGPLQRLLEELPVGLRTWEVAMALSTRLEETAAGLRDDMVVTVLQRTG